MNTHRPPVATRFAHLNSRTRSYTFRLAHAHALARTNARAHTHTRKRVRARTRTPTHALPHTHASRHLHMKLHTHAHACVCARASTRARTHSHTYADSSPACGRERAWRNRAISRTHAHAQNVSRARTNTFQDIRARAQPDVQAQPGTHGTGACTHMRVRAECAHALTRY